MKKLFPYLVILLVSCSRWNEEIDDIFTDYFPLRGGMKWVYMTDDSVYVEREVLQDSGFSYASMKEFTVEFMGELEYYLKGRDATFYRYSAYEYIDGSEVILEQSNLILFYQPVFKPQYFADTISRVFIVGDTVYYVRTFYSRISESSTGERKNLEFSLSGCLYRGGTNEKRDLYVFYELAPDTGPVLIRRVLNGDTIELNLVNFEN
jgi:hypothetical protein